MVVTIMKLIFITGKRYILTDASIIKLGDWFYGVGMAEPQQATRITIKKINGFNKESLHKITHASYKIKGVEYISKSKLNKVLKEIEKLDVFNMKDMSKVWQYIVDGAKQIMLSGTTDVTTFDNYITDNYYPCFDVMFNKKGELVLI